MAETVAYKFRAFISYSHADTSWAKWLHRSLESFPIDKDLVGRETATSTIPKTLRAVFRDRDDFTAGHALNDQTLAALDASHALIVICSPTSAKSHYVTEEIRLFKSRHPERPVIPLIVDGKPGDKELECFPRSLKFKLTTKGQIGRRKAELLAADVREQGDGKHLALAKVVAGLLGVSSDDIFRRAERERRRKARINGAMAVAFAALVVLAGAFGIFYYQKQQTLADVQALVAKYSVASEGTGPGPKQSLTDAITAIAQGAARDPRYAKALDLLKAGKPEQAEPLLAAVAEDKEKLAARQNKEAAEAYRNLASIAAISNHAKARGYYAKAAALDPDNVEGMYRNGAFQQEAGSLNEAEAAYRRVISTAKPGDDEWVLWSRLGIGDIDVSRGDLSAAMDEYHEAGAMADRLAAADPSNAGWLRDLSVSYNRVGNVLKAQGKLEEALTSFKDNLGIRKRLAAADPSNAGWLRYLSVSYAKVGDVLEAQGKLKEALASYKEELAIGKRVAAADPSNAGWQRDLSISYEKVGDVLIAQGKLAEALASYRDALAIAARLAKADPGNAGWQRDLSVCYAHVGDVLMAQGQLEEALASYKEDLAITKRLAAADPSNAQWQRDLSVAYEKVGNVVKAQGKLEEALASYKDSLGIRKRLAAADPSNAGWQHNLYRSYDNIGDVLERQGNLSEALKSYRDSLAIRDRLAKADPGNALRQSDLLVSYAEVGAVLRAQGNLAEALKAYREGLIIADRLAKADASDAGWQDELSVLNSTVGDVLAVQGKLAKALKAYRDSLAVSKALVAKDGSNTQWQSDLNYSIEGIGSLAYRFILARDFAEALETADEAIALEPDKIWLYTNRAHALMFLGRTDEARSLYLKYQGAKNVQEGKSWDTIVLADFAELRKAELTNPLMDEIEKSFSQTPATTAASTQPDQANIPKAGQPVEAAAPLGQAAQ
jgi:tetratricopeptide (TPR) repeat protein